MREARGVRSVVTDGEVVLDVVHCEHVGIQVTLDRRRDRHDCDSRAVRGELGGVELAIGWSTVAESADVMAGTAETKVEAARSATVTGERVVVQWEHSGSATEKTTASRWPVRGEKRS